MPGIWQNGPPILSPRLGKLSGAQYKLIWSPKLAGEFAQALPRPAAPGRRPRADESYSGRQKIHPLLSPLIFQLSFSLFAILRSLS